MTLVEGGVHHQWRDIDVPPLPLCLWAAPHLPARWDQRRPGGRLGVSIATARRCLWYLQMEVRWQMSFLIRA